MLLSGHVPIIAKLSEKLQKNSIEINHLSNALYDLFEKEFFNLLPKI